MSHISKRIGLVLAIGTLAVNGTISIAAPAEIAPRGGESLLWQEPADIRTRDLFLGSGGAQHQPRGPFTFVKEDMEGSNPKFVVRDNSGATWKAKLGAEARPETVASRFVWAVGYFSPIEYFVPSLPVQGKPKHLHRGRKWDPLADSFVNVRLKLDEKGEKKLSSWHWRRNELSPRELNGLRVMMALMNNWDLKDENNAVYAGKKGDRKSIYMVSDLGATFGAPGLGLNHDKSRDNLRAYSRSKFITKTTSEYVDFGIPARPALLSIFALPDFVHRVGFRRIGKQIPRADALWVGRLLAQLSPAQIRDAFRAGGYSPEECNAFAKILENRITALNKL